MQKDYWIGFGLYLVCLLAILCMAGVVEADRSSTGLFTCKQIDAYWKGGRTLPVEASRQYPVPPLRIQNDTGINVLVDMAHKCDFFMMWNLRGALHRRGIRTVGSHAALDSVIKPGSLCRVRIPVGDKLYPFAWWPAPKFNVVMTEGGSRDPEYLAEEREALLTYVRAGGGLIVSGVHSLPDAEAVRMYSLNLLLAEFGAKFIAGTQSFKGQRIPIIEVDENWEVAEKGDSDKPVIVKRRFGNGRIVLLVSRSIFRFNRKNLDDIERKADFITELIKWAAGDSSVANGEPRLPAPMAGGGGNLSRAGIEDRGYRHLLQQEPGTSAP